MRLNKIQVYSVLRQIKRSFYAILVYKKRKRGKWSKMVKPRLTRVVEELFEIGGNHDLAKYREVRRKLM